MRHLHAWAYLAILSAAAGQVQTLGPLTVSATRDPEPRSQIPFTVEMIPGETFSDGPSLTVDDALRGSADFGLFRRNDSMTANPTTQGVSLRGLGPSGASRSLVLLDGVPLNDPFGGWVPWSMVPLDSLAGAEIVPGGGAAAWGNAALGGVIQLFSAQPPAGSGYAVARGGDFGTRSADLSQSLAVGPGTLELRAESFATDGVVLVAPESRGLVDTRAASRHNVESAQWRGTVGGVTAVVAFRNFDEWRDNGTAYQHNTLLQQFGSLTLSGKGALDETWSMSAYLQGQRATQTFSAVNAARSAETPSNDQFAVPTTAEGWAAASTWTDSSGGTTTAGSDVRDIRGETREDYMYSQGRFADQRFAGGRQTFAGLFAERSQALGAEFHAVLGARLDRWQDGGGHQVSAVAATGAVLLDTLYPTRDGTEFSPSAGLIWQAVAGLQFHISGQRAFRQPTLNELYRPFRQGSTTTLANAGLATEHADSGEVGASWSHRRLELSLTGFAVQLEDPVANVTLAQGPGTFPLFGTLPAGALGQERLNLGRVDSRGLQLGAHWAGSDMWRVEFSALYQEATVIAAPVAPNLVGNTSPEVPRWNAALGLRCHPLPRMYFTVRVRSTASQYDDDQNLLPLAAFTALDGSVRFVISRQAELFGTVDNVGNARIETAHSTLGVYNLAPPRLAEAGARLSW